MGILIKNIKKIHEKNEQVFHDRWYRIQKRYDQKYYGPEGSYGTWSKNHIADTERILKKYDLNKTHWNKFYEILLKKGYDKVSAAEALSQILIKFKPKKTDINKVRFLKIKEKKPALKIAVYNDLFSKIISAKDKKKSNPQTLAELAARKKN